MISSIDIVMNRGMKLWLNGQQVRDFNFDSGDVESTGWTITTKKGEYFIDLGIRVDDFLQGQNVDSVVVTAKGEGAYVLNVNTVLSLNPETGGQADLMVRGEAISFDENDIYIAAGK